MKTIRTLLITIVVLCVASICQAQEKDTLKAKLARLEAAAKANQSSRTTKAKPVCKKKTLAEKIAELEARQKGFHRAGKTRDTRIASLENKLLTLQARSKKQSTEVLLSRIAELESKVQQLQTSSESAKMDKAKTQKDSVSKVDSTDDFGLFAGITELEPIIAASEVESGMFAAEPVAANFLSTTAIEPEESPISFDIGVDYLGKYIWRGQNLSDDPVFQLGMSASYKGFTVGAWGSLETTSINNNSGEFTEWDYSLDYSGDVPGIEGVGYSVGLINYHFPSVVGDTTEFYWGLNFDLPLSPSVTVYHDIDNIEGTYVSVGLGHSIEKIVECAGIPIGMDIGASLGWGSNSYNRGYWSVDSDKLNDLAFSVSFPVEIRGWTFTPSLNYVTLVNNKIRQSDAFNQASDYFFLGIGVSKSF